jgi:hypothetical protein
MDERTGELIDRCRAAVAADPQHDLRLGLRQRVWVALGPRQQGAEMTVGRTRRIELACAAAKKVLPIWSKAVPDDRMPEVVLRTVDRLLGSPIVLQEAWEERNLYWQHFVDKSYADESLQIVCAAGFSAVQALTVVLDDEKFDPQCVNDALTDQEMDADDLDAAMFASAAFADGPVWVPESDARRRKEFWLWWLESAARLIEKNTHTDSLV